MRGSRLLGPLTMPMTMTLRFGVGRCRHAVNRKPAMKARKVRVPGARMTARSLGCALMTTYALCAGTAACCACGRRCPSSGRVTLQFGDEAQRFQRCQTIHIDCGEPLAQPVVCRRRPKQSELPLRLGGRATDGWSSASRQLVAFE